MDLPAFPEHDLAGELSLGELVGSLSHALDLTSGQPPGHCVRCCRIGMAIGREHGLSDADEADLYYTLLLKDLGCSSNAARICQLYLADDRVMKHGFKTIDGSARQALAFIVRNTGSGERLMTRLKRLKEVLRNSDEIIHEIIDTRCQQGADIARMMGFSEAVALGIAGLDEHWDGGGRPIGASGDAIPLFSRIALVAQVMDVFRTETGPEDALDEVRRRAGHWFDPRVVEAAFRVGNDRSFWASLASDRIEQELFDAQPRQDLILMDDHILDEIVHGFSKVVDAKSPFTFGHSTRVALYVELIAVERDMSDRRARWLRRAALLHDVGKLGVSNLILDKPSRLTDVEFDVIKTHPVLSSNILSRISVFGPLAAVARAHHERLDGSGYPDGLLAPQITEDMRILSVADIYDALSADRPYRAAKPARECFEIMDKMVGTAIDGDILAALKNALVKTGLD